jgi:hypothetical protein
MCCHDRLLFGMNHVRPQRGGIELKNIRGRLLLLQRIYLRRDLTEANCSSSTFRVFRVRLVEVRVDIIRGLPNIQTTTQLCIVIAVLVATFIITIIPNPTQSIDLDESNMINEVSIPFLKYPSQDRAQGSLGSVLDETRKQEEEE